MAAPIREAVSGHVGMAEVELLTRVAVTDGTRGSSATAKLRGHDRAEVFNGNLHARATASLSRPSSGVRSPE
ncbi:MAG: hypothetical protein V9G12_04040 [Microthrixaceae bacterium]